jgi:hypothetical protein
MSCQCADAKIGIVIACSHLFAGLQHGAVFLGGADRVVIRLGWCNLIQ